MDIREKYIDFMLDNMIETNIKVQLPHPHEDGKLFWTKLGLTVYMNVELEVIEKYTRSVKFNFKFDKYDVEKIIFIPIESSPMSIKEKLYNTLTNLVSKTFIADGRQDDLKKMYDEKRKTMFSGLSKMVGKVVEIEENYGDLYEKYTETKVIKNDDGSETHISPPGHYNRMTKDEFIKKLKTDDEFNKTWGYLHPGVEIDIYGELYEKYYKIAGNVEEPDYNIHIEDLNQNCTRLMTKEEFIDKIKTDNEFAKKWGGMRENIVE